MRCPRCHDVELVDDNGPLSSATCARCGGGLIPDNGLAVLLEEIKSTREELNEIAAQYGGARVQCPACKSKMSPLVLRGEHVDLCFGCGSLFVDKGELELISGGRHHMPQPTEPAPIKALANPAPAQVLVRVDERSLARHVVRAVLAGTGAVSVVWALVGLVPVASLFLGFGALTAAAALSRRDAFDVLPRARRMVRWRGFFAPSSKENVGEPFSPDSCVVVRRMRVVGQMLPGVVIDLVDGEGRQLVRLRGPILAHTAWTEAPRYARALGVSVRFDVDADADDVLDTTRADNAPALAKHDIVRVVPELAAGKTRRLQVRAGDNTVIGTVITEVALKGRPQNLDELLAEHFVIADGDGESVRLFSTTQLAHRATILVGKDGRVLGHVYVRRGPFADTYGYLGPQGRRAATAVLRHGTSEARVLDGHGRGAGVLEVETGSPSEPRPITLHAYPGRLTGDARWGLVALALHASLAAAVPDVD